MTIKPDLLACHPSYPDLWIIVPRLSSRQGYQALTTLRDDGSAGPTLYLKPDTLFYPEQQTQRVISNTLRSVGTT